MTQRGSRSGRRLLASLLTGLVVASVGLVWAAPAPARAVDTVQLSLSLDSVTISGTKPKDKVTLKLTLRNTGTLPAYRVLAYLWRSHDPIRDQGTLASVAAGATTTWGERLIRPSSWLKVTDSTTAFFPGASRSITLTATLADLGFTATTAAYAVGADVVANADQSSKADLAAQVRSFVPMPGKASVPLTSIVLLSAAPTKLFDNLFANEDLTGELTGRLDTLLQASGPVHSWLIDPGLLDEVRDQADGYQVVDGTGTKPGTGQQVAANWLARFQSLDRSLGGRVLFANPDSAGAEEAGAEVVQWSSDATATVSGVDDLPLVAIPTGRIASASQLDFLSGSGAQAILAANTKSGAAVQNGGRSTRILAVSPTVPAAANDQTTLVQQQQFALAETAIAGQRGQARLLTTAADLAQDAAARPAWTTPRPLGDLLDTEPEEKAGLTTSKPSLLGESQFTAIDRLRDDFSFYSQLVPGSSFVGEPDAALLRAASSAWITDPKGGRAYVNALRKLIGRDTINDGVRLDASGRFVMSARTNQFPITVRNELSEPITVRVEVTTTNAQRLSIPPTDFITIAPGQSETVNIRPEASGNGLISGTARAVTSGGKRVGREIQLTFEVTELGFVAWLIVGASAVVLVATTALRIRQVRRRVAAATPRSTEPKAAE